ncbi:ATP-binding cassette domain-containing protein [Cohnella sp. CFH 77786]|uniref:ABC transporter ATP-binding protein n=1 Tax=Cohnella sp. CFH 77786 TaxID=2662265 RepID=UPI001C60FD20|nr:ABC transporter ATP-binding protein [Cohnella sp. CFH 77786]MBW5448788.1 ATP-binding cassette domain-containing protein [Cohnella sp. CFH 77786]
MEKEAAKPVSRATIRRLASYALPYKYRLAVAIFVLMTAVGIDLLGPVIYKTIIDKHLSRIGTNAFDFAPVLQLIGLYIGAIAAAGILNYTQSYLLQTTALRIVFNMRMDLIRHIQRMAVKFFDNAPVGQLVNRIANDTESIRDLYMSFMATFTVSLVQVSGIFLYLFYLDARMASYTLILLPLYATIMFFLLKYGNRYMSAMRARISDMNTLLSESILVMPVLQLFRREKETIREFERFNQDWQNNNFKHLRLLSTITRNLIGFSGALLVAGVIWHYGGQSLRTSIEIGVLVAFLDYINRLFHPVIATFDQLVNAQRAFVSAERVFAILNEPGAEIAERELQEGRKRGDVKFDNVWFAYKDDEYVLRGISFEAKRGQTVAFVGHTGSGKSSVMNLLLGFYEARKGTILVDGHDISGMPKQHLRQDMAVVLQDPFLFAGDIKFNVSLYNPAIGPEEVRKALRDVGADTFVDRLPKGIDEPVVERGSTLSAGQRQLITFARALAFNPSILILDEATASIDSETEGLIQNALQVLSRGRTTFVIAHRLSTIRDADQILVLHKGEIVERGKHDELMELRGRYYKMYELQKGGALVS